MKLARHAARFTDALSSHIMTRPWSLIYLAMLRSIIMERRMNFFESKERRLTAQRESCDSPGRNNPRESYRVYKLGNFVITPYIGRQQTSNAYSKTKLMTNKHMAPLPRYLRQLVLISDGGTDGDIHFAFWTHRVIRYNTKCDDPWTRWTW